MQGTALGDGGAERALVDNLGSWQSFAPGSHNKCAIFQLSSLLETLPMLPVSLDTAHAFIQPPDLSHRCPARVEPGAADAGASVVSGIKGLFGFS